MVAGPAARSERLTCRRAGFPWAMGRADVGNYELGIMNYDAAELSGGAEVSGGE